MKILFINKYDITGGAGIAAFRLHQPLRRKYNTENLFLVGIKKSNYSFVIPTRKSGLQNLTERGLNFLLNQIGLQYKYHPFSSRTILRVADEFSPDVISLHNAHGGYFQTSLLSKLSKIAPIVWTLHDMWSFTANAAHTFEDTSWKKMRGGKNERKLFPQIGLNTGNWLLSRKKIIYSNSNLTIVAPSKWLFDKVLQSPVFEGKKMILISNGIDLNIFSPKDKAAIRIDLGIKVDSDVLIFSAEKVLEGNYKGGVELINILRILDSRLERKIYLIIMGYSNLKKLYKFKNFKIHETGYLYKEEDVAKYLSAADVFIYPTNADNLPNALLEASACGIPSIANDIGGCKEIIDDNISGFLIPGSNAELFVEKIIEILSNKALHNALSTNCRKIAEMKFDSYFMAEKYHHLFESVLYQR